MRGKFLNAAERLNQALQRRPRIVRIFPNEPALLFGESAQALERALALDVIAASRVLLLSRSGKEHPDLPAERFYSPDELGFLDKGGICRWRAKFVEDGLAN